MFYGYSDILEKGVDVVVKVTNRETTIIKTVTYDHCTVYKLENPCWEPNWYFRHELEVKK